MRYFLHVFCGLLLFPWGNLWAKDQLSTSSERSLTTTISLKNKIPLVVREIPGSDIVHLEVSFRSGTANLPSDRRVLNLLTFDTMPYGTKKFSKQKIFEMSEKYSFGVECSGGVELSHCQIETVIDYLPQALTLFTEVVLAPVFDNADLKLVQKRRIAEFQRELQNPESRANAVVNTIYYSKGHPYRFLPEDGIKQVEQLSAKDLKDYHRNILNSAAMTLVYVGPELSKNVRTTLETTFGSLKRQVEAGIVIPTPKFDPAKDFAFEHRDIPTAYIRLKFNAPSILDKDAPTSSVLFEILGDKLHEEIRTKRSLSYAIQAMTIQYSEGIGIIGASTSKPQETLQEIANVVSQFAAKGVTQEELNEYKNVFVTNYYLTQETHDSLAGALATAQLYFGNAKRIYDLPEEFEKVSVADINRLAKSILTKLRGGIVFNEEKFKIDWFQPVRKVN